MRAKPTVFVAVLCAVLCFAVSQYAQERIPGNSEHARNIKAVSLLRNINTAEASYFDKNHAYATWPVLLSAEPKFFEYFLSRNNQGDLNLRFADLPDILPGWSLRLNVHADGRGYDVLLVDTTDKRCGYAALSDESGLIRQSKTIDCEI
jgi:hypothetical protein